MSLGQLDTPVMIAVKGQGFYKKPDVTTLARRTVLVTTGAVLLTSSYDHWPSLDLKYFW